MKMHLRANKPQEGKLNYSRCAAKSFAPGHIIKNNRETYRNIPQENILGIDDFLNVQPADRCTHCCNMGLISRNRKRKAKGLKPVKSLWDER